VKQSYYSKFFCFNVYVHIWSIFAVFLLSQEAQAKSKEANFNSINTQLAEERSLDSPPKASTSAQDLLESEVRSQKSKVKSQDIAQNLDQDEITRVTGVEVKQTAKGLELILKTVAGSKRLVPLILPEGNNLVIDILDANLAFSIRNGITKTNPAPGIRQVNLVKTDQTSIRLTITGEKQAPRAEVIPSRQNLILSVNSQGTTAQTKPESEIEIISTGEAAADEYFVPDADIGGRIDSPLRDVPQSVQVIPQQVIEDQQATGLEEVLENSASVTFLADGVAGFRAGIRGFDNASIFRDGFRLFEPNVDPEVANLERVEILKGPASIFFGEAEPGGLINLVTKKPLSEPYYNFQFQGGNSNFISPSIDLSGPLTGDGRLLYRLNALYRQEASVQDYDTNFNRFFIAPTLAWQIGDRTDLTVNLEYIKEDNPIVSGTVAIGEGIADIPLQRVINNPDGGSDEENSLNVGYTFEHNFSKNWQLRNQFSFISEKSGNNEPNTYQISLDESTGILDRSFLIFENEEDNYMLYTNVRGKFNTGSIKHNLLFGVDVSRVESDRQVKLTFDEAPFLTPINIFDPVYSAVPTPNAEDIPLYYNEERTQNQLGIYLKDQIDLLDNLIVSAGVRYDTFDQDQIYTGSFASEASQTNSAVTPNVGIVYQPIEPISLYTTYSQSFRANQGIDAEGKPLEPQTGQGFDVGIKGELMENRLSGTLAFFNITKQNVATIDPNDPSVSVATGEQRSRGVDFDLTGEILPGWKILTSYAYIDAVVTEDNDATFLGSKLSGIPEHSFSLWTTYEIQQGGLQGLGFGGGFNFVGARQGGLPNSFEVDSYFLTNATIFYRRNNWQANLNIDNLFDVGYIKSVAGDRLDGIIPGNPLTLRASVSVEF
jgi:iron complex outermembrane recepter protein